MIANKQCRVADAATTRHAADASNCMLMALSGVLYAQKQLTMLLTNGIPAAADAMLNLHVVVMQCTTTLHLRVGEN